MILTLVFVMGISLQAADPWESVAIVSMANKPIISTMLNGKEAFFLIDTGSGLSIMDVEAASTYHFAVHELPDMWAIHSISLNGHTRRMEGVGAVKLFLGESQIKTRWYGTDIAALVQSIKKKTGIPIVGIIGSDVMKKYGFQIDFDHMMIRFRAREMVARHWQIGIQIAIHFRTGLTATAIMTACRTPGKMELLIQMVTGV